MSPENTINLSWYSACTHQKTDCVSGWKGQDLVKVNDNAVEVYSEIVWECSENAGFIFGAEKLAARCAGSSGGDTVSKTDPGSHFIIYQENCHILR